MEPKTFQGIGVGDLDEAHKLEIRRLASHIRVDSDSVFNLPDLRAVSYTHLTLPTIYSV